MSRAGEAEPEGDRGGDGEGWRLVAVSLRGFEEEDDAVGAVVVFFLVVLLAGLGLEFEGPASADATGRGGLNGNRRRFAGG